MDIVKIEKIKYNTNMSHEPKKRHSRTRQGKRRASIKLETPSFVTCVNCKSVMLPHKICKKCGFYNGRQVLNLKAKEKNPGAKSDLAGGKTS